MTFGTGRFGQPAKIFLSPAGLPELSLELPRSSKPATKTKNAGLDYLERFLLVARSDGSRMSAGLENGYLGIVRQSVRE